MDNNNNLSLKEVLKTTYKDKSKAEKYFNNNGLSFDRQLSNNTNRVFVNDKNAVVTFRGTHNLINDIPADLDILLGTKNVFSNRLAESKKFYKNVKEKYPNHKVSIAGHSLGSYLASNVSNDKNDKIYSYGKGSGLLAPILDTSKSNEISYRNRGDLISLTNSSKKNTKIVGGYLNPLLAHSLEVLPSKIKIMQL